MANENSNFSQRINALKFKGACLRMLKGKTESKRCLIIPVDDNPEMYVGEKGVYINFDNIAMKEVGKYGDTHIVKGKIPKEIYDAMSDEEKQALPIYGQMRPLVRKEMAAPAMEEEVDDDLPF